MPPAAVVGEDMAAVPAVVADMAAVPAVAADMVAVALVVDLVAHGEDAVGESWSFWCWRLLLQSY